MSNYLETMGLVVLAIACAVLGQVFSVPFLTDTVAPGLFGVALGYLGHQSGVQLSSSRSSDGK